MVQNPISNNYVCNALLYTFIYILFTSIFNAILQIDLVRKRTLAVKEACCRFYKEFDKYCKQTWSVNLSFDSKHQPWWINRQTTQGDLTLFSPHFKILFWKTYEGTPRIGLGGKISHKLCLFREYFHFYHPVLIFKIFWCSWTILHQIQLNIHQTEL